VEEDDLFRNPARGIKKHKEYFRSRYLSVEEIAALLKACRVSRNIELYAIVVIALNTGMRLNEILTLRAEDVNLRQKTIVLREQITKNGDSRIVPLNKTVSGVLSEHMKQRGRIFKSRDIRCAFENALKRAGIDLARFHDLRRTFGTHLLLRKISHYKISHLLGHSNILVTERYLTVEDDSLHECVNKIGFK
jgi:integrase